MKDREWKSGPAPAQEAAAPRVWHKGPPPHIGWWNASADKEPSMWRWWDGAFWSLGLHEDHGARVAANTAKTRTSLNCPIYWTDYWPADARVPRVDPTTKGRTWHKGPPPHIGWWNASTVKDPASWRWWNGEVWSIAAYPHQTAENAAREAAHATKVSDMVEWNDYWPADARVPRVDPTKPQLLVLEELARIPRIKASDFGTHMKPLLIDCKRLDKDNIAMPQVDQISQMAEQIDNLTGWNANQAEIIKDFGAENAKLKEELERKDAKLKEFNVETATLKEQLRRLSHRSRYDSTTYVDTLGNRQHVPGCHATAVFAELRLGLCLLDQEP